MRFSWLMIWFIFIKKSYYYSLGEPLTLLIGSLFIIKEREAYFLLCLWMFLLDHKTCMFSSKFTKTRCRRKQYHAVILLSYNKTIDNVQHTKKNVRIIMRFWCFRHDFLISSDVCFCWHQLTNQVRCVFGMRCISDVCFVRNQLSTVHFFYARWRVSWNAPAETAV